MIKIYKGYDANFVVNITDIPTSVQFIVPITGSFSVTGSFSQVTNGINIYIPSATTTTFPTGSVQMYAVIDNIPEPVGEATIVELTTVTESHAEKVLSAIEAVIENRATKEQMSISIAGRAVQYISLTELLRFRLEYKRLVKQEKIEAGLYQKTGMKILTRWGRS